VARPAELLPVDVARERVLRRFQTLDSETVGLGDAHGRALATSMSAPQNLPPFANSSMDGFALNSASSSAARQDHPVRVRVTTHIPAGTTPDRRIDPGECARIMTGAPIPLGANAVVPFEEVEDLGSEVVLSAPIASGACVRPAGQDVKEAASVLRPGTELRAAQLALLAALGFDRVPVIRRPVVAVLATGDELVAPGQALLPGQIYNSNSPMLAAAIREAGAEPRMIETAADNREELQRMIQATTGCDLLITSGGASVGDFDYVKDVVAESGHIDFWRIRLRPGKPLLFGSIGNLPVIGLPGNPTSAMVTFEVFVRPAIRTMLGLSPLRPRVPVIVDERIDNHGGRETYARVRLRFEAGRFHAALAGPQDSAMLAPLANADGLLVIPHDRAEIAPGDIAEAEVWILPDTG
jgi:molybdopterin molybdotransferase